MDRRPEKLREICGLNEGAKRPNYALATEEIFDCNAKCASSGDAVWIHDGGDVTEYARLRLASKQETNLTLSGFSLSNRV